jgi:hypothetical protein
MPALTRLKPTRKGHTLAAARKASRRALTSGRKLLPKVDGRLQINRRYREIGSALLIDQGGDQCSEARVQLIRRFAAASVLAEQLEARLANGEQIDISEHALLCSTLVRVARQIGVNRIARDITPSLGEYLQRRQLDAAE